MESEMSTHRYSALALVAFLVACQPQESTEAGPPEEGTGPVVRQATTPLETAAPRADDQLQAALAAFEPIPDEAILDDLIITPEKVELGKILYLDPRLSRSGLISCNTCHNIGMAGVDVQRTSVGHGWQEGPRNAPTVLNAVFNVAQFWDGRAADLEEQAMGPVQAAVEMANTPDRVLATLESMPEYVAYFEAAFPGEADPVTFENMARAIEAFEATLITPDSRFDLYLAGDRTALTDYEKEGLRIFVESGCASCHNGVNVGGASYHAFGVHHPPGEEVLPPGDLGRYEVTGEESDQYVFKAPTLRNIELTPPYFHSGVVWDLDEAVAVMGMAQLGTHLSADDAAAVVAFLGTLTGVQPQIDYPVLPARTETTPLPDVVVVPSPEAGEAAASADAPTQTAAVADPVAAARSRMAMGRAGGRGMGMASGGMGTMAGGGMGAMAGAGMSQGAGMRHNMGQGRASMGQGTGMRHGMGAGGNCPMMSGDAGGGGGPTGGNCPMSGAAAGNAGCSGGNCPASAAAP
jgi:cytochrome c peroxidase